ncbi:MAG: ATP-binding protein [Desulfamplus sp.]|nr:ATP-binding protein [Desulfamplus sp.]
MDYIPRTLEPHLQRLATQFPVVTLTGPRQSGKSTLVRHAFSEKPYVSCEDPDNRLFATQDPRGFLDTYPNAVIDEAQKVPDIFSYIQTKVDATNEPGQYILTGSHDFILFEKISQSLAGRTAILRLLPFSLEEIHGKTAYDSPDQYLFNGFYPRLHQMAISPKDFYSSYVQTYIERDVRLIKNITNLSQFQLLLKMCAGRLGQLLNLSSLGNECGISHSTVKSWLSILEASYIIFFLQPHHVNFNKRLVKMPKLYFHDPGLAAFLLGIESVDQVATHYNRGGLFESLIISELIKKQFHTANQNRCYFWRDNNGNEIDCLMEKGDQLTPIEIKSGKTITRDYFKGVDYYQKLAGNQAAYPYVVYGGDNEQKRSNAHVLPWNKMGRIRFPL